MTPGQKFATGVVVLGFMGLLSAPLWTDKLKDERKRPDDWDEKMTHVNGR